MNKKHLISKISSLSGIKKSLVARVLDNLEYVLVDALQKGETVNISGFGKFFTKQRCKREYISFQTGEKFLSPAKLVPVLKFSKKFVDKF